MGCAVGETLCVPDVGGVVVCCRLLCIVAVRLAAALCVRWVSAVDVRVTTGKVKAHARQLFSTPDDG